MTGEMHSRWLGWVNYTESEFLSLVENSNISENPMLFSSAYNKVVRLILGDHKSIRNICNINSINGRSAIAMKIVLLAFAFTSAFRKLLYVCKYCSVSRETIVGGCKQTLRFDIE